MLLYLLIYPVHIHIYIFSINLYKICLKLFFFLIYVLKKKNKQKRLRWLNCVRHSVLWRDQHKHNTVCMHWFPWKRRCDSSS